jgi:hypothetical protein
MAIKIGVWIHNADGTDLGEQIALAAANGMQSVRSYDISYAEAVAPALRQAHMSLLAGIHVDAAALLADYRSQARWEELARYHALGVSLEALSIGNELREGGDAPADKRFTARLSFSLANLLALYRQWLTEHNLTTPITYAMEGIVFDAHGNFHEWLWPLIDACDVITLNAYPMDASAWFTFGAFAESRRFLVEPRARNDRLALFEAGLRQTLQQLEPLGKPVVFSETGFPSAIGYRREGERLVVPESDGARFGEAMRQFVELIHRVNADYGGCIRALYFYEWRDNLYHSKIWNVEQSPIHVAFGLCDRFGTPKFGIQDLVDRASGA